MKFPYLFSILALTTTLISPINAYQARIPPKPTSLAGTKVTPTPRKPGPSVPAKPDIMAGNRITRVSSLPKGHPLIDWKEDGLFVYQGKCKNDGEGGSCNYEMPYWDEKLQKLVPVPGSSVCNTKTPCPDWSEKGPKPSFYCFIIDHDGPATNQTVDCTGRPYVRPDKKKKAEAVMAAKNNPEQKKKVEAVMALLNKAKNKSARGFIS